MNVCSDRINGTLVSVDRPMKRFQLLREFWLFLSQNKKLWLAPMILILVLIGALLIFAQSSALAPFIYSIF